MSTNPEALIALPETATVEAIEPVAASERIDALDLARGFALLGIILMNVEWFERPIAGLLNGIDGGYTGVHLWIDRAIEWLIQGKFYPLFSLLFGMGFAVMLQRGEARSGAGGFVAIYTRRLLALLAFGILHGVLFYPGDILHAYALGGFALLVGYGIALAIARMRGGRRLRARWLAIIPLFFMLALPVVGGVVFTVHSLLTPAEETSDAAKSAAAASKATEKNTADSKATDSKAEAGQPAAEVAKPDAKVAKSEDAKAKTPEEMRAERRARGQKAYDDARKIYQTGTWAEITALRASELKRQASLFMGFGIQVVLIFMLGAWFVFSGALHDIPAHIALFRRLALVGLPLGMVLALAQPFAMAHRETMPQMWWGLVGAAGSTAVILMCVGYFSVFVLVAQSVLWSRRLSFLSDVGRMALTHYILQSAVLSTIFAAYGLGLHGQMQRGWQVLLALALFAIQVLISRWWMARYRFGPLEWLWRALTYLRAPPMLR